MFNKYSSEIFDIVGRHLPEVHYYADHFQLYLSFNPSCASSQDEAVRAMETCGGGQGGGRKGWEGYGIGGGRGTG